MDEDRQRQHYERLFGPDTYQEILNLGEQNLASVQPYSLERLRILQAHYAVQGAMEESPGASPRHMYRSLMGSMVLFGAGLTTIGIIERDAETAMTGGTILTAVGIAHLLARKRISNVQAGKPPIN